jgi:hypothetical protein
MDAVQFSEASVKFYQAIRHIPEVVLSTEGYQLHELPTIHDYRRKLNFLLDTRIPKKKKKPRIAEEGEEKMRQNMNE